MGGWPAFGVSLLGSAADAWGFLTSVSGGLDGCGVAFSRNRSSSTGKGPGNDAHWVSDEGSDRWGLVGYTGLFSEIAAGVAPMLPKAPCGPTGGTCLRRRQPHGAAAHRGGWPPVPPGLGPRCVPTRAGVRSGSRCRCTSRRRFHPRMSLGRPELKENVISDVATLSRADP
jgi:hypothetical protein